MILTVEKIGGWKMFGISTNAHSICVNVSRPYADLVALRC